LAGYDFHQLSPDDFERLTLDLLQAEWGYAIESFKAGRDGGIDLRHARAGATTIVQCKHYVRTGVAGLLRDLKAEGAKVRRLKPHRYVLVTSMPLSPSNKDAVVEILDSDAATVGDVLGQSELNDRLRRFPKIEQRHYKLWLASRDVLDRVLNNAVVTQSEFHVRKVFEQLPRFVPVEAYPRALNMLNKQRVVVVAGPPGIGKTTLANMLLYEHLARSFQAVVIERDIREARALVQDGVQQVFYFDDFLGATFLRDGAGNNNGDRDILSFIDLVRASPLSRLILTTREHILNQALQRSERLRHSLIGDFRITVQLSDCTAGQKAKILYNHVYFSDLPAAHIGELLRDDFYLQVIKHVKFSPRLIEWLSSYHRIKDIPANRYRVFVERLLHDPSEIWLHAYEREISDAARSLLLALWTQEGKTTGGRLEAAFVRLHDARARRYGFVRRPEDYRTALRELVGSFIQPSQIGGIEVLDPSVLDLLNRVVGEAPDNAIDMIEGACEASQLKQIWKFAKATNRQSVRAVLRREAGRIAPHIGLLLMQERRIELSPGSSACFGPSFEERLTLCVDMADTLDAEPFRALVAPLAKRMRTEWKVDPPQIIDALDASRVLRASTCRQLRGMANVDEQLAASAIDVAALGCRAYELAEVLRVSQLLDPEAKVRLREGFAVYRRNEFKSELRECRSNAEFDSLLGDLEAIEGALGIDIARERQMVEEALEEFEKYQSDYGDHLADQWKESRYLEREGDADIRDLFGSLKDGRG